MKDSWNERFKPDEFQYGIEPNDYFKEKINALPVGRILIPAAGEGRDAIYAAKLGWEVYAFDSSERGREKAIKLANTEKVLIHYHCEDAMNIKFPLESFDAVALSYFHLPEDLRFPFHLQCIKWLKPNGHIILEAFNKKQLTYTSGGPKHIDWLFNKKLLESDFDGLEIIENKEIQRKLNEGPLHQGLAEVVQFNAFKKST